MARKPVPIAQKKVLKTLHINVRSLMNKKLKMSGVIIEKNPDVVIITESWTNPDISNNEIDFDDYTLAVRIDRKDTSRGRGGGLLIYLKNSIKFEVLQLKTSFDQIGGVRVGQLDLIGLYRSPNSTEEENKALNEFIANKINPTTIIGDANFPNVDWASLYSKDKIEAEFLDAAVISGFQQMCEESTHEKGNILDIVLTNVPDQILKVQVDQEEEVSDHHIVEAHIKNDFEENKTDEEIPDFSKADFIGMYNHFAGIDWDAQIVEKSTDQAWETIKKEWNEASNLFIPKRKRRSPGKKPWFNKNVLRKMRKKQRHWRFYKATGKLDSYFKYKAEQSEIDREIEELKNNFENSLVKNGMKNSKRFFGYMKQQTKSRTPIGDLKDEDGNVAANDEAKCNILNSFFTSVFSSKRIDEQGEIGEKQNVRIEDVYIDPGVVRSALNNLKTDSSAGPDGFHPLVLHKMADVLCVPLTILFNKSLQTGEVPQDFRDAHITPIFKKGRKSDPSNYRPISLTSQVGKLMERIIKKTLTTYLEDSGILSNQQHGFRRNRSCVTNLLEYLDKVTKIIDSGEPVDIVFVDYKKAFDKVDHKSLIAKAKKIGIDGLLLNWIESWLTGRRQKVVLNGSSSEWSSVLSGVPQGSVLGPLLFLIYINDLPERLTTTLSLFADDLKMLKKVSTSKDAEELQQNIETIESWAEEWQMQLNADKCSVMHLGRNNQEYKYKLKDQVLKVTECERDLGVMVQNNLKNHEQCKKVAAKCNQLIGQVRRSFICKESELMLKIYKIYILPHLEYACSVWNPSNKGDITMIESIQRRFTRIIEGTSNLSYEERLIALELPSLEDRRRYLDLVETFRILNGFDVVDHEIFTVHKIVDRVTRTSGKINLSVERSRTEVRNTFFTNRAAREWNKLPSEFQEMKNLDEFREVVQNFCFYK